MMPSLIRKPRTDEKRLWDLIFGGLSYNAFTVAHSLGLFRVVASKSRTLAEVAEELGIELRPARALLAVCASLGLVRVDEGIYSLTPMAEDYLLESSPTYFGGFLELLVANDYTFSALREAVVQNAPQVYGGDDLFKSLEQQEALARAFTRGMHGHSAAAALAWPDVLDLSEARTMLDVGGGSGIHSIGAAIKYPGLKALIFDLPPVCEVGDEVVADFGLQDRVKSIAGDMWNDPFPKADVHFYADIFHDWRPEKCRILAKKSFEALERGGRIILHELLYDDDKVGPLAAAAYSVAMLLWTEGQQHSAAELTALLAEVGFREILVRRTFGYWSIVTGRK